MKNMELKAGDKLKIKGMVLDDADGFQIDLGCDKEDLALHFNPRFNDDLDGTVFVCNSKTAGCWGDEKRELNLTLQKGAEVKIVVTFSGHMFEVELPDEQEVHFPNREDMDLLNYLRIRGDFKLTSFKIC
ncbi:galectin-2-like [Eucyclogobius newberryi]|uniref:galectin-2-like n=1 Tax=Eucyclogobius newberryi TaxID=166745 RepID=UPI003B5BDD87